MMYEHDQVMSAFELYAELARKGEAGKEALMTYQRDDGIRNLLLAFVERVDCVVVPAGDTLYLVPKVMKSPFHLSNEEMKRRYFSGSLTPNIELYLLYFAVIVLFGEFYNNYSSLETSLDFISLDEWLERVDEKMETLKEHGEETLAAKEEELEYSWRKIIEKWDALNEIKESAKAQKGRTISKLSFLRRCANFLLDQGLLYEIGNDEFVLTDKAMRIVQLYFMDIEYNRGIIEFLYENRLGEKEHA